MTVQFPLRRHIGILLIAGLLTVRPADVPAQEKPDLARLIHPEVAAELSLTDNQRVAIQELLSQRQEARLLPDAAERAKVIAALDDKISAQLTDEQRQAWLARAEGGKLKFQFRDQKWDDVLQWFARQDNLTLVMDRVPPGSFTYGDTRSYSAAEAIDLLNSVLATRGFTLVRRERMLLLLELSNAIPIELLPRVTLEQLPARGRFELVSVMFPLGTRPVESVMQEVRPYLGTFGRAVALPQSRQLLVIETAGKMQTISQLIASVPEPVTPPAAVPVAPAPPGVPVFASYSIGNLDPSSTAKTIRTLVDSERITVDEKTRVLSAFLPPNQQTAVKNAVEQMLERQSELTPLISVAYRMGGLTVDGFQRQVTAVAPRATMVADTASSRVLITAESDDHQRIGTALQVLGVAVGAGDEEVRSYQVGVSLATTLATALRSMIPGSQVVGNDAVGVLIIRGTRSDQQLAEEVIMRWRGSTAARNDQLSIIPLERPANDTWLAMVSKLVPEARLWFDASGNRLMMLGSADDRRLLEPMLPQLATMLPGASELRRFELSKESMAQITALKADLEKRLPPLQLTLDSTNGVAWSWGPAERQKELEQALEQLRTAPPVERQRVVVAYTLQHGDAAAIKTLLDQVYKDVTLVADGKRGQILATGTLRDHAQLKATLVQLDQPALVVAKDELRAYPLKGVQPAALLPTLQAMWPKMTFTADAASGRVIATGSQPDHQQLQLALERLNGPPGGESVEVRTFAVPAGDMVSLPAVLAQIAPQAVISTDPVSRTVIVWGTKQQHERIAAALAQLGEAAEARTELKTYSLSPARAASLKSSLATLFPSAATSIDSATGTLIVVAPRDIQNRIAGVIEELEAIDTPEAGGEMRVFPLEQSSADAASIVAALRGNLPPNVVLQPHLATNTLIAVGPSESLKQLDELLRNLNAQLPAAPAKESRSYSLSNRDVVALQRALATSFPNATISADSVNGEIIVAAKASDHDQIAAIVNKMNQAPGKTPMLETVRARFVEPRAIAAALQQALAKRTGVGVSFDDAVRAVFIVGMPEDHALARQIIEQIDQPQAPAAERQLRTFQVRGTDGRALMESLRTLFRDSHPQLDLRFDALQDQLVVIGGTEQIVAIEKILKESEPPPRHLEVFVLKTLEPAAVRSAISALFADLPIAHAPSVSTDDATQQLLVRGTTEQLAAVRELLGRLGEANLPGAAASGPGASRRIRSIPANPQLDRALDDLRRVWPQIRPNPIRVLGEPSPAPAPGSQFDPPAGAGPAPVVAPIAGDRGAEKGPERNPERTPETPKPAEADVPPTAEPPTPVREPRDAAPIIVVRGASHWTLASDDREALDQFESLLQHALSPQIAPVASTGNYAIYLLRHAGAEQLEQLFSALFKRGDSETTVAGTTRFGRVTVIADPRINAIIVHGNRADRVVIEELLSVLDSSDMTDTLQSSTPKLVPLRFTDARRVQEVIRDVYRSQLSTGGGRKPLTIPEGISSDVKAMIQQINASSAGPILTVGVDVTTNALVLKAPPELAREITEFVQQLDSRANLQPATRIEVIKLRELNTTRLKQSLPGLLSSPAKKK